MNWIQRGAQLGHAASHLLVRPRVGRQSLTGCRWGVIALPDLNDAPPGLVRMAGNQVAEDNFPQFTPQDFHERCNVVSDATAERCWLSNNLLDLKTECAHVRQVAKDYLTKLAGLGATGFRFHAAKHIETEFFTD